MKGERNNKTLDWVKLGVELAPECYIEKTSLLREIRGPGDLKNLTLKELETLASEIRGYIVSVISRNGGHLASSLGAVELIIALHRVFDAPEDTIIFDVGHQAYAHKILTGRKKDFPTIRKFGGLAPFVSAKESKYDEFTAGHTSTSLSLSSGVALSYRLTGKNSRVIAVIGDGAITAGMAWEALNFISHQSLPVIIVLNDNRMSIAKNVGGISQYLRKLERSSFYLNIKRGVKKLGRRRKKFHEFLHNLKSFLKSPFIPPLGTVFEELGFRYVGIVDGHNLKELIPTFESLKKTALERPVIVHVSTIKGKGLEAAEKDPEKHHGVSSKFHTILKGEDKNGKFETRVEKPSFTQIFSNVLQMLAHNDEKVCGITAAMPEGTGLKGLMEKFPERFWDVGIAEQHAVTMAAALAKRGFKPFVAIYSTFLQRAVDQIIHDVALDGYPVKFMIDRSNLVGEDGPTHHGLYDEAFLNGTPNMVIATARDGDSLVRLILTAYFYNDGPIAIRYHRGKVPCFNKYKEFEESLSSGDLRMLIKNFPPMKIGQFELIHESERKDLLILSAGRQIYDVLQALDNELKKRVSLLDVIFTKPIQKELTEYASAFKKILIVMESTPKGAVEALKSALAGEHPKIEVLSLPDAFIEHGDVKSLKEKYRLTSPHIRETIEKIIHSS